MKRNNSELIGSLIRKYLREEGLETQLNELRMVKAWTEVMGAAIEKFTGNVFVKNRVLHIQIKSPALRANLMMGRASLVERLNQHVGARVIEQIEFH